jgi:PA14 domain/Glycosyl hydrolases family 2, sugar binding domain/Glycosyl hydrolases family 2/Glycosyl hydrolases family 2, TIM barrel domain
MHAAIAHDLSRVPKRAGALMLFIALAVAGLLAALPQAAAAQEPDRHGLRGEYYVSSGPGAFDFHELKATVVDPNIEFPDLEGDLQALTGQNDDATVRWTGRLQPEFSESYTFSMIGDNGFRLWIDGRLVIDHWVDDWDKEQIGEPIALEAGRKYDIKVEFFENEGGSNLRLRWESPSQPKEIVPREAFYLPEGFDPPGPYEATLGADGKTLTLDFTDDLDQVPASAADHFTLTVAGTEWPIASARIGSDPSQIVIALTVPVPAPASSLRLLYDGEGGITQADGASLAGFTHVPVINDSEYLIQTRWADEMDPDDPLPEYPRPQMERKRWQSLNGTWQFASAGEDETAPSGEDLDERIVVPFPVESRLSGLERREDRMWYRRTFTVPSAWRVERGDERLLLHFDAVDWQATVYVNGEELATHKGGYERFSVDVTDALRPGRRQELVVGVFDPTDAGEQAVGKQRLSPGGIMYTPASGIWQTVWMEPVPAAHVTGVELTPDIDRQSVAVTVRAAGVTDEVAIVTARAGNRTVGWISGPANAPLRVQVPRPTLWSPDRPFLYDLDVELVRPGSHGKRVDTVKSYFGMRSIDVEPVAGENRIVFNGEPVFNMGPLDQGFWPDGIYTAPTDDALKYDLVETKRLGFNTVRKHVKVESDRWYYWADRLGLLVWQDMPSMSRTPGAAGRAQFETELRGMIEQHRSHPSIVMWVPFNEGWGQYDQARIADLVKSWDPSRLVNNMSGINCCGAVDGGNGDVMDFHIYPGPGTPGAPSATRASVLGEYGGLGLPVFGHTWSGGGWGYAVEPDPQALTNRYVEMTDRLRELQACNGLSAAIYTQTTDVETELNGLMTYDRALTKPRVPQVRRANEQLIAESAYVGEPGACASRVAASARTRTAADASRTRVPARGAWDPAPRR